MHSPAFSSHGQTILRSTSFRSFPTHGVNRMTQDTRIAGFIEKALDADIPHQTLLGVLVANGWPEKEVYNALAEHYRQTGLEIPRRAAGGTSAKEAFFYLLIFSTLATWTIGLGCLAFALIDRWMADPLFYNYQRAFDRYTITTSLATLTSMTLTRPATSMRPGSMACMPC